MRVFERKKSKKAVFAIIFFSSAWHQLALATTRRALQQPFFQTSSSTLNLTMNFLVRTRGLAAARGLVQRGVAQRKFGVAQRRSITSAKPPSILMSAWGTILKRNSTYVAYVATGCIVLEVLFGGLSNAMWRAINYGSLYEDINWDVFKVGCFMMLLCCCG